MNIIRNVIDQRVQHRFVLRRTTPHALVNCALILAKLVGEGREENDELRIQRLHFLLRIKDLKLLQSLHVILRGRLPAVTPALYERVSIIDAKRLGVRIENYVDEDFSNPFSIYT